MKQIQVDLHGSIELFLELIVRILPCEYVAGNTIESPEAVTQDLIIKSVPRSPGPKFLNRPRRHMELENAARTLPEAVVVDGVGI